MSTQEIEPLGNSLLASFQSKVPSAQSAGACSAASQDSNETPAQVVQKLRDGLASGPKVLVVCGHPAADLASEMTHVSQYNQALKDAFGSHVMAYLSDTPAEVILQLSANHACCSVRSVEAVLVSRHRTCPVLSRRISVHHSSGTCKVLAGT